jgi:hypothetical protein
MHYADACSNAGALFFSPPFSGTTTHSPRPSSASTATRTCTFEHLYGDYWPFLSLGTCDACRAALTHAGRNHHQEHHLPIKAKGNELPSCQASDYTSLHFSTNSLVSSSMHEAERSMAWRPWDNDSPSNSRMLYLIELPYMEEYYEAVAVFWKKQKSPL